MDLTTLQTAVVQGDRTVAVELTRVALREGVTARALLEEGLIPAMATVGDLFERQEYYVPEMLMAARAMQSCLALLRPELVATGVQPVATAAVATVRGDLHDIGKNLLSLLLEGAGFAVINLGVDCPPERIVTAVQTQGVQVVCLSALLTTTLPAMRGVIAALEAAGLRQQVVVLVGGAAVGPDYAAEIGADGYAPDAASGVAKAKELVARLTAAHRGMAAG